MMSLSEEYQPIRILDEALPLKVWWEDRSGDAVVYEHHLSGHRMT